jgi:hypothetical protein
MEEVLKMKILMTMMPWGFEYIQEERAGMYSMLNPVMRVGSLYPNMKVFRLAMRHYAIQREFELGIECPSTSRYRGFR